MRPTRRSRVDLNRAVLLAMSDRIDEARALGRRPRSALGSWAGTARLVRRDRRASPATTKPPPSSCATSATELDRARSSVTAEALHLRPMARQGLCAAGRYEEAEQRAEQAGELRRARRPMTQIAVAAGRGARRNASRGEHTEAERLAREALTYGHKTDSPMVKATPTAISPRCSRPPAAARRRSPPGARRSTATSARGSSRSPAAHKNASPPSKRHLC